MTVHSPTFFSDRLPGILASRITATSNAIFTVENMSVLNVLPPCVASSCDLLIASVNLMMAAQRARRHLGVVC